MILFPTALMAARRGRGGGLPQAAALSLDFVQGIFAAGAFSAGSLAELPGYAFVRSGEQGAGDSDGTVDWFAANAPAINGKGFHAYGALTNNLAQSNDFAGWTPLVDGAGSGAAPIATANQAAAPDGAMSAALIAIPARSATSRRQIIYKLHPMEAGANTASLWVRAKAAGDVGKQIVLTPYDGAAGTNIVATLSAEWQRIAGSHMAASVITPNTSFGRNAACAGTDAVEFYAWEAGCAGGNLAGGGPLVRTSGTAASIGASDLRISLANGDYAATFTFDDDSQQLLPMTVGGGQFVHPVKGALNRAIVTKTVVTAA